MKALVFKFKQLKSFKWSVCYTIETHYSSYKRTESIFRWEREDVILDHSRLDLEVVKNSDRLFEISFPKYLASDMGRVRAGEWDRTWRWNITVRRKKYLKTSIGSIIRITGTSGMDDSSWAVSVIGVSRISTKSSKVLWEARSLFVYSEVGKSSVVGNQVTD